ncbi:MAG: hypothetical protein Q9181_007331, partial [Wetmoreana brouardii]
LEMAWISHGCVLSGYLDSIEAMKHMRSIAQLRPWTESEVQILLDCTLEGKSYLQISLDLPKLFGKAFRHELECRKCLQANGTAHNFFPKLPIYWAFSLDVEMSGETQVDHDTSSMTEQEMEGLILFLYHNSGVNLSRFKLKRSTAFLTTKFWELQKNDQMVLKIAGKHIEEKRRGVRATLIGHLPTTTSTTNAINEATAKEFSNARRLDETESEDSVDAMSIDGGEAAESGISDSEFEDPPKVRPGQPRNGWPESTDEQVAAFLRKWAGRPPSKLTTEQEDRSFIKHARRWGMTVKQIRDSGVLKEVSDDVPKDVRKVEYQIRLMLHQGKDVHPRTVAHTARRDKKASRLPRTTRQKETQRLMTAIEQVQTPQQIVYSGIITVGTNTPAAVKHRWESMSYRGFNLPPARQRRITDAEL